MISPSTRLLPLLIAGLLCATPAVAQDAATEEEQGGLREAVVNVGSQPARDLGMARKEAPAALQKAMEAPYSLSGLDSCEAVAVERAALDEALGPDLDDARPVREKRGVKLAEAGGRTLVNSIIPFRGLVREISGAAPADRRLEMLRDAGHARRGFLRGVEAKLGCDVPVVSVANLGAAN